MQKQADLSEGWDVLMLPSERHHLILKELEAKKNVTVIELRELLKVSIDTVRRDLKYLDDIDKLKRVHGGAISKDDVVTNQTFMKRKAKFIERKQEIAKVAAGFIRENNAISLNAGTTNIELAKHLVKEFEQLTVITNSLKVAEVLTSKLKFTIIITGGTLNHEEFSIYNQSIEEEVGKYNIDIAFINVNAISLEKGLTDFRQGESEVINAMIKSAEKTIVIADSSKFETTSYLNICGLDQLHTIVTDSKLSEDIRTKYEGQGINIVSESPGFMQQVE